MIIQSSTIQMKSQRNYSYQTGLARRTTPQNAGPSPSGALFFQDLDIAAKNPDEKDKDLQNRFLQTQNTTGVQGKDTYKSFAQIQQETIDYLMQLFFGKNHKLYGDAPQNTSNFSQGIPTLGTTTLDITTWQTEKEETSFSTTGTVMTADGRSLSFQVDVTMSRSFTQYHSTQMQMITPMEFCDPLVINLDTNLASVSDQKFFFDLDADGHAEAISQLNAGSGFLALDKNNDGVINDGSELFGAQSQDGFADLSAYDSDHNGWIDEADEIFNKLLIWSKDTSGKDILIGLGQAGIGAIYLGNTDTEFSLNSLQDNSTNALIRKTGIFLYENGMTGTIQHVDFAK